MLKIDAVSSNKDLSPDDLKGCIQGGVHRTAAHLGERCRHARPSERASINKFEGVGFRAVRRKNVCTITHSSCCVNSPKANPRSIKHTIQVKQYGSHYILLNYIYTYDNSYNCIKKCICILDVTSLFGQ